MDDKNETILQLKALDNQNVYVEKKRRSSDPVQCFRCQAYGHTKNY